MADVLRVEMLGISKSFGGVHALKDVSFRVKQGEIHALVGENGAGKSTLMKILSGAIPKDRGEIFIDGKKVSITDPKSGQEQGIAIIYQEFALAPHLTVTENIFLNRLSRGQIINWKQLHRQAQEVIESLGFDINPTATVKSLSVAYQQVVEICKAISENSRVLILDEPTAVLATREVDRLFQLLFNLKSKDVSIIYISHRLEEVFRIADTITVLRDGSAIGTVKKEETNKDKVINMMIGRKLESMYPPRKGKIGEEVLRVEDLKSGNRVRNVSLSVKDGEVVGISGLVGAGRTETVKTIFGVDRKDGGKVYLQGKLLEIKSPYDAVRNGLGLLPEDRKNEGVLLDMSIKVNTTLSCLNKIRGMVGWILQEKEKNITDDLIKKLTIKTISGETKVANLSGGNQQKVALAKWLASQCKVIIFDEPTRGVDVGAKVEIYKLINELAEQGVGILMVSSEMPELIGMCDRVIVMKDGRVMGELKKEQLNEESLLRLAIGG